MNHIFGKALHAAEIDAQLIEDRLNKAMLEKPFALFILSCDTEDTRNDTFEAILKDLKLPVFGGIFPALVIGEQVLESGFLVIPVLLPVEIAIYSQNPQANQHMVNNELNLPSCSAAMVLVDGLANNIDDMLNQLYAELGPSPIVFGGGAGSLRFVQQPCLFTNSGIIADAMLVITMKQEWDLAIGHGWEILEGPFLANQVDQNRLVQLNFQNAVDVYKDSVEAHDERSFVDHDFFEMAKTYPFGLQRLDDDLLVRDPVAIDNNALLCVGNIPESTMLYILKGKIDKLVEAAAAPIVVDKYSTQPKHAILFDCISRKLFMQNDYLKEIDSIGARLGEHCSLFGALVLGEIASGKSGIISFHNKTAVTAIASNGP